MKIKNKFLFFIFSFFTILLALLIIINTFTLIRSYLTYPKLSSDSHQILRVIFYGSSESFEGTTVSANISLLDRSGMEIARIERSWPDSFLAVDFSSAEFGDSLFFFPEKIYGTDSVINMNNFKIGKKGTNLIHYYIENGECMFGRNKTERKYLYSMASFALNPLAKFMNGLSNKYTVNLSECKSGIYYGIFAENGLLTLRIE